MWRKHETIFPTARQKWKQDCVSAFLLAVNSFIICPSAVKEIDLALWRSAEAIANDKREFMNDGEWELLSIPSQYWQIRQDDTDYAQIQFNVWHTYTHHHRRSSFNERFQIKEDNKKA